MADHFSLNSLYRGAQELGLTHYDGGTLAAVLMDKTLGHTIPYDISSLCLTSVSVEAEFQTVHWKDSPLHFRE